MTELPAPDSGESNKEQASNSPRMVNKESVFSYNLDDSKTPGGLKVRWKIRVATGPEAAARDARQAKAIKELLRWAHQQQDK